MFALANTSSQLPDIIGEITAVKSSASDPPADKNHLMVTTKLGNSDACVTLSLCNDPIPQAQQSPINLQETLDFEPSERDIGELSQPPSTEIRSVTPPPSHALGHQCVRDVETSPEQEFHPESRRDAPTRAGGRFARESHVPPSPPDVRQSHRSRPPSVRRREAAAASPPRLRRRR
ncbi:uncharacterized protein LOC125585012 isoform X3 [Brassica napus]|uniref:uncharacterized protein LOC125585012 isoform X3 n=1 Tax=Brassica napus TaxID=3708 RepID=UPI00207AB407|nr:uncharacterized protein LOC125585012 isoform X3 [Brassica napus]